MEITPELYAIDFHGRVWAYLFREQDRLTLVDTGIAGNLQLILRGLAEAKGKLDQLEQIIITHCHKDHVGTLAEIQRASIAPTAAHERDSPMIEGHARILEPELTPPERLIFRPLSKGVPDAPPARIDRVLRDGDEIELAGASRVVHVPGHTPGSIALHIPSRRILLTGDAVASLDGRPIVGAFNVDPEQAKESFRRLSEIDFEIACFGHGRPLMGEASLAFRRVAEKLH